MFEENAVVRMKDVREVAGSDRHALYSLIILLVAAHELIRVRSVRGHSARVTVTCMLLHRSCSVFGRLG